MDEVIFYFIKISVVKTMTHNGMSITNTFNQIFYFSLFNHLKDCR